MYLPISGNPNFSFYEAARPVGVRINENEKRVLQGTNWAVHPNLPFYQSEFAAGRMAVVRDVGILNEPTTPAQYANNTIGSRYRPQQIGAHDVQQDLWRDGLQHQAVRDTGWFGRFAALMDQNWNIATPQDLNNFKLHLVGRDRQNRTYAPFTPVVLPVSARAAATQYGAGADAATLRDQLTEAFGTGLSVPARTNKIGNNHVLQARANFAAPAYINSELTALPGGINFGTAGGFAPMLQAFYTATQNAGLGIRRSVGFSATGGWDTHASLRAGQDPLLTGHNNLVRDLRGAIDQLGLTNNVVVYVCSEFGRTFRSNSNIGTDHGWAGHSFVFGGPVIGGSYGQTPNYSPTGPNAVIQDAGNTFVPTTSTEQFYATFLRWMGLPANLVSLVLPASASPRLAATGYTPVAYSPQALTFLPY